MTYFRDEGHFDSLPWTVYFHLSIWILTRRIFVSNPRNVRYCAKIFFCKVAKFASLQMISVYMIRNWLLRVTVLLRKNIFIHYCQISKNITWSFCFYPYCLFFILRTFSYLHQTQIKHCASWIILNFCQFMSNM